MRRLLPITLLFGLLLSAPTAGAASVSCEPARVDVGGYKLWMQVAGVGGPTVVFESGGGDDSSVWAKIEPEIRQDGVRTVLYDRAGLGQSDLEPGPYSIDHEAKALERALDRCNTVLGTMARLKIDERLAAISEKQAAVIIAALDAGLDAVDVPRDQRPIARKAAARHLRVAPRSA